MRLREKKTYKSRHYIKVTFVLKITLISGPNTWIAEDKMQHNVKFGIAILFWQKKKVPLSQSSFLEASYTLIWDYFPPPRNDAVKLHWKWR